MGWGEVRAPDPAKRLAEAVRTWDASRTTERENQMLAALGAYDDAQCCHPVTVSIPEPETGRRSGW